jgi:hypothetical protein
MIVPTAVPASSHASDVHSGTDPEPQPVAGSDPSEGPPGMHEAPSRR